MARKGADGVTRRSRDTITYEMLDMILQRYKQEDDKSAAADLIQAFEGFLIRYLDIIHRGFCDIDDRMAREYVVLYMKDADKRKHLHQWKRMPSVRQEVYHVAENVQKMFASFQRHEIWNEIICALLTLANRYKSPDGLPRFHMYVRRAYRYQLKRQMEAMISDALMFRYNRGGYQDEEHGEVEEITIEEATQQIFNPKLLMLDQDGSVLGENWINGFTCTESFVSLTKMERRILKLYYQDDLTDQQIAYITGAARVTVNRRRSAAKEKVYDAIRKGYEM